jgi:hypothetical protein
LLQLSLLQFSFFQASSPHSFFAVPEVGHMSVPAAPALTIGVGAGAGSSIVGSLGGTARSALNSLTRAAKPSSRAVAGLAAAAATLIVASAAGNAASSDQQQPQQVASSGGATAEAKADYAEQPSSDSGPPSPVLTRRSSNHNTGGGGGGSPRLTAPLLSPQSSSRTRSGSAEDAPLILGSPGDQTQSRAYANGSLLTPAGVPTVCASAISIIYL